MKIFSVSVAGMLAVAGMSFVLFTAAFAEPVAEASAVQFQEIDPLFALFAENDTEGKAFFEALAK